MTMIFETFNHYFFNFFCNWGQFSQLLRCFCSYINLKIFWIQHGGSSNIFGSELLPELVNFTNGDLLWQTQKYFLQLHVIMPQFTSNCLYNRFASNYDTILLQFCKVRFEFPIEMLSQVTYSHAFLFSLLSVFPSRATFYLTFKRTSIFHFWLSRTAQ